MAQKRKKSIFYIKKEDLYNEVKKSKELGFMTDELAKMIQLLAKKIATSASYARYPYIDDMQAFAVASLCKQWSKFNIEEGNNAFSYYTSCINNSFKQYIKLEKKQRKTKDELLIAGGLNPSHTYMVEYEEEQRHHVYDEEDHEHFISELEKLNNMKKEENKESESGE